MPRGAANAKIALAGAGYAALCFLSGAVDRSDASWLFSQIKIRRREKPAASKTV